MHKYEVPNEYLYLEASGRTTKIRIPAQVGVHGRRSYISVFLLLQRESVGYTSRQDQIIR